MKLKILILLLTSLPIFAQGNQKAIIAFDTMADMVARGNPRNTAANVVEVLGYYARHDGGGGLFIATNTVTSTNIGTRIKSQLAGWSWERVRAGSEPLNVAWFGAIPGDLVNDAVAMQATATATAGKSNSVVTIPPGNYTNLTTVIFTNPVTILGHGAVIRGSAARLIQIGADNQSAINRGKFNVEGLSFYFGANTVSNSIYVAKWIDHAAIKNCRFNNTYTVAGASEIYFAGENWSSEVAFCHFVPSGSVGSRAITTNPDSTTGTISPNSQLKIFGNTFSGLATLVEPAIDVGNSGIIISHNKSDRNKFIHFRNSSDGVGSIANQVLHNYAEAANTSTNGATITWEGKLVGLKIQGNYFNVNNRQVNGTDYNGLVMRPSDGSATTVGLQYIGNYHAYFTNLYPIYFNAGNGDTTGIQYGNFKTAFATLDYGSGWSGMTQADNLDDLRRIIAVKSGTATLVGGTVTVNTTSVTADSRIMLTVNTAGGTVGSPYVSARVAGTSFDITSTSGADTSTVFWTLHEP